MLFKSSTRSCKALLRAGRAAFSGALQKRKLTWASLRWLSSQRLSLAKHLFNAAPVWEWSQRVCLEQNVWENENGSTSRMQMSSSLLCCRRTRRSVCVCYDMYWNKSELTTLTSKRWKPIQYFSFTDYLLWRCQKCETVIHTVWLPTILNVTYCNVFNVEI